MVWSRLLLFSEGSPADAPFAKFVEAFPDAELRLESVGDRYGRDNATLAHARRMASADVLVTTCGTFGALLTVIHWRGVTLQHPCTAQLFPEGASPVAPYRLAMNASGAFDEDEFLRAWEASRTER